MGNLTKPSAGEDCRKLHRHIAPLAQAVNSLLNMDAIMNAKIHATGKLQVGGGQSVLRLIQLSQILPGSKPKGSVTVAVSSSDNPSNINESITFTAILSDTTATGTIQFSADGTNIGSPVTVANGAATSTAISSLTVGTHTIIASYSGDTKFAAATGNLTQTVNQAVTTVFIYGVPNPYSDIFGGAQPFCTAFIEIQDGNGHVLTGAGGTVNLRFSNDGGKTFQPVTNAQNLPVVNGKVSHPLFVAVAQDYIFRAIYHGNPGFADGQGQFTEVFKAGSGGGTFPTNFTLAGQATILLGPQYTYNLTAPNNFTGQVEVWVPSAFVTEHGFGGAILFSGTPAVTTNGTTRYPIILNMVNGFVSFTLIVFGGVPMNYGNGDFATGIVDLAILNPAGGPAPTVNNSSQVQLTVN